MNKMLKAFNSKEKYMGNTEWQKQYTKHIIKKYPDMNFIYYTHDIHYVIMLAQRNVVVRFIMKVFYDIICGVDSPVTINGSTFTSINGVSA